MYAVLQDLLFRKRVAAARLSVDEIAGRFTLTVADAAERLGVHPTAVTRAIAAQRVSSWVKGGKHWLNPNDLGSIGVEGTRRGPRAAAVFGEQSERGSKLRRLAAEIADPTVSRPTAEIARDISEVLSYRVGHVGDSLLRIRVDGWEPSLLGGAPTAGKMQDWKRAEVLLGRAGKLRFFELEPAEEEGEVQLGELYVRGKFRAARKVNNPKAAREAWDAFEAA